MPVFSNKFKLGLDIGSAFVKVCLPKRGGRPMVAQSISPEGSVSKGLLQQPETIREVLNQLINQQNLQNCPVVATLPASTLVLRHIQIPMLKPKETGEAVEWEARRVLPFPLEEAQVDWLRQGTSVNEDGEMQDILLVAVRDNIVQRYVEAIKDSGLRLVALDVAPMALGRWLLKNSQVSSLIIDLGAETTQLHFFDKARLIFSRSVSIGGSSATQSISSIENISFQEAETMKLRGNYKGEWLESWLSELGRELQRSLEYFRTNFRQGEEEKFGQVLLSGGASSTRGVEDLVRDITGLDPGYAEFSSKERSPRHDKIVYNVALGAGMWEG